MTEVQVFTVLATALGIVATVLNLVAFVREKDRSHTRAGLLVLTALLAVVALLLLPRYAPDLARQLVSRLPAPSQSFLEPWLAPEAPTAIMTPALPAEAAPPLQGSFVMQIKRNFFGGIKALVARFQFVNLSSQAVRVTSFQIRITQPQGRPSQCFEWVLSKPLVVTANGNAQTEVELNAEIRDCWLAWQGRASRGPVEIRWACQDAAGNRCTVLSSNG